MPTLTFVDSMVKINTKYTKTVLFNLDEWIYDCQHYPCKLAEIKGPSRKAGSIGLLFQKGWPWTDFFNHHLLRMKESGLMERLYQINMKKPCISCPGEHTIHRTDKEPKPIGTDKICS